MPCHVINLLEQVVQLYQLPLSKDRDRLVIYRN